MQSGSLRMLEKMSDPTQVQEQIIELSRKIEEQNKIIEEQNKLIREQKTIIDKLKETPIKNNDNKMSIIIENYKKSLIVMNKYKDKETTYAFKEKFKELDAKWTKNNQFTGWLFLGKYDANKTLEECAQFILNYLSDDINEYELNKNEKN